MRRGLPLDFTIDHPKAAHVRAPDVYSSGWLGDLERQVALHPAPGFGPFQDGVYGCPWLRKYVESRSTPPGIALVLTDWGNEPEPIASALADARKLDSISSDRTINNLHRAGVLRGFDLGEVCVLNAIWGLRAPGSAKSGGLKSATLKAAWPIWTEALRQLRPRNLLITCGAWLSVERRVDTANEFLAAYGKWADRQRQPLMISPNVRYGHLSHPCRWPSDFNFQEFCAVK